MCAFFFVRFVAYPIAAFWAFFFPTSLSTALSVTRAAPQIPFPKKKNSGLSKNKVIGCTVRRSCEELPIYLYTFLPSFLLFPLNAISNVTFPFQRKSRSKKCREPGKKAIIYHYTFTLFCSFLCPFRDIHSIPVFGQPIKRGKIMFFWQPGNSISLSRNFFVTGNSKSAPALLLAFCVFHIPQHNELALYVQKGHLWPPTCRHLGCTVIS